MKRLPPVFEGNFVEHHTYLNKRHLCCGLHRLLADVVQNEHTIQPTTGSFTLFRGSFDLCMSVWLDGIDIIIAMAGYSHMVKSARLVGRSLSLRQKRYEDEDLHEGECARQGNISVLQIIRHSGTISISQGKAG